MEKLLTLLDNDQFGCADHHKSSRILLANLIDFQFLLLHHQKARIASKHFRSILIASA
jgi:hypothetical protein